MQRAIEAGELQRQWLETTLASIGDGVIATDRHGKVLFLNPVAESLTGWKMAEARGMELDEVFKMVDETTRQPVMSPVGIVLTTGRMVELANHTALLRRDGMVIAIEDSAAPIRDASGQLTGAVMVFHDVTDKRRTEATLRNSEQQLRAVFEHAAVGIAVAALNGRFQQTNQKFCDILGYSLPELRQISFMDLTHPDDREATRQQMQRLLSGAVPSYCIEKRYICRDGNAVWSRTTVTALRDPAGAAQQFIGIIEDISDQKSHEHRLTEESRILELLNATGTLIAAQLDLQTLVQKVTDAATQLSGARFGAFFYNVADEQGESFQLYTLSGVPREAFDGLGLPRNTPVFEATFRGEGIIRSDDITADARYGRIAPHHGMPKGHPVVRSYLAAPVVSRSGEVIGGLFFGHPEPRVFTLRSERLIGGIAAQTAVAIDNARLYEAAQRELSSRQYAEAALRETDRRKDEFLATLAHELRNPLAPIRQAALISRSPGASDDQKRWSHEVIERQVSHMALLLDDLLDISRITRGTLELRLTMTDLKSVVDAAIETARPVIDAKRHRLQLDLPHESVRFAADPLRLAQVLSNLLTNAAKYTDPEGTIRLSVAYSTETLTLKVSDTGIGIPREALSRVFTMFSQVKAGPDRSDGGLGIGLALARGLVRLHGGTIEAHSAGTGHGSEFTVQLPRRVRRHADSLAAQALNDPHAVGARRVLIADDNRDAADSLAALLRMDGHQVSVAHDGVRALELFDSAQPEVALLDIGMPGMSGYEVARQMRERRGAAITLIAITGWGKDSDKANALAAGFNLHFTKPIDPDRLLRMMRGAELRANA